MHCQKHDAKRRQLIKNLGDMKVKLDLVDLFCKKLKSESYQAFFFLRQTNLFGGDLNYRFFKCFFYIYFFIIFFTFSFFSFFFYILVHAPHQMVAVMQHFAVCQPPINNIEKKTRKLQWDVFVHKWRKLGTVVNLPRSVRSTKITPTWTANPGGHRRTHSKI